MAYEANKPMATDLLDQSQEDIQGNFQAIATLVAVNHVQFNDADQGKHKWVTFPQQGATPPAGAAFSATELGLYNAVAFTGRNELYVNKTNQATVVQVPTTASILSTNSNPGQNSAGWTYLPSGMILKWGSGSANGNTNFLFPVAGTVPPFTNVVSMQITTAYTNAVDGDGFVRLNTFNNLGFSCFGSARTTVTTKAVTFQYLAIGY